MICLGLEMWGGVHPRTEFQENANFGDFTFNAGEKEIMILRKFADSFNPVNTGSLRHRIFEGQAFTLRCGSDLYMTLRQNFHPGGDYLVFKLNKNALLQ